MPIQIDGEILSTAEENLLLAKMRVHLGLNRSDSEIQRIENWSDNKVRVLKRKVYQDEIDKIRNQTPEEIYTDYRLAAAASIDQLNTLIEKHCDGNQPTAVVGAVKAKHDILKSVIETGQDFGLVSKKTEMKGLLVAGVDLTRLSLNEVKDVIAAENVRINNLIDIASGSILQGPKIDSRSIPAATASKSKAG